MFAYSSAVTSFHKAAEQGDINAQYALGMLYYNGDGVEKEMLKSSYWLKKAANQGDFMAEQLPDNF